MNRRGSRNPLSSPTTCCDSPSFFSEPSRKYGICENCGTEVSGGTIQSLVLRGESDPKKLLELVVSAITNRYTDSDLAKQAVSTTISNYENQLRVFLVATAKAKLDRILRLMELIDITEGELLDPSRVRTASTYELLRIYAIAQGSLTTDLDYVKQIVDMRTKLHPEEGKTVINMFGAPTKEQIEVLADVPALDNLARDRVRRILDQFVSKVKK